MGFSYTRPFDILDTGRGLLAPTVFKSCLFQQADDSTPFGLTRKHQSLSS